MWQKYYKIAERQLLAGKFKTVEGHALKALQCAEATSNQKQIAKTLSLLSKLYLETENPKASEMFRRSVECAQVVYGSHTPELAEELDLFSCWLEHQSDFEQAESVQMRALEIWEASDQPERVLSSVDHLVEFYVGLQKFEQAEAFFLRSLHMRKRMHGAVSQEVQNEVPAYIEILEGLGRHEEAAELETNVHHCATCGPEDRHVKYPPDVDAIIASITEVMEGGKLDEGIEALRAGLSKLQAVGDERAAAVPPDDPFRELKLLTLANPARWARSSLAQLLRVKGEREHRLDLLTEAAGYFRYLLAQSPNDSDRMHLMLTLLDLSADEPSLYQELERLLLEARPCAATLYTKALMLFKRYGSTAESRSAMRAALDTNPHVPQVLATGLDPAAVPNHFSYGGYAEAEGYCLEASHQWISTPGATDFMIEVMARALPASLRHTIDRVAPPVATPTAR